MASEKNIKDFLVEHLRIKGADVDCFREMIEDYMTLLKTKKELRNDIKKKGVIYEDVLSTGIVKKVHNPSVKELVIVSKQANSILRELGINPEQVSGDVDDSEL